MLGRQGPLDRALVTQWMTLDWQAAYAGEADAGLRSALQVHLAAMLAGPFPGIVLNGDLIGRAREQLQTVPVAQRVYAAITSSPAAKSLPEWRVSDAAGPAARSVFVRRSGQKLTDGIPGLYTGDGFRTVFLPAVPAAARAAAQEDWVLGTIQSGNSLAATPANLERDVTGLYLQDFAERWDRLIGDLSIVRVNDLQAALRVLNVLSSPSSPIRLLVVAASNTTRLSGPSSGKTSSGNVVQAGGAPLSDQDRLRRLMGTHTDDPSDPASIAGSFTAQHFKDLHSLTTVPPNSAPNAPLPIDEVIAELGQLYRSISDASETSSPGPIGGAEAGAAQRIQAGASRLPQPVQSWVLGVSRTSASMSIGSARERIIALWRRSDGASCKAATTDRYPFSASATQDISLGEFARLFGRGGMFDSFFNDNLKGSVDTSRHPWRWRTVGAMEAGLGNGSLKSFETAAAIRDTYFIGATPSVGFTLTPTNLDGDADSVTLTTDGQAVSYNRSAASPVRMQWPGLAGSTGANVSFARNGNSPIELAASGPWAWFHLLDHAQLRPLGRAKQFSLRFIGGASVAGFTLQADSASNPFFSNPVAAFRCPWRQ